MDIRSLALKGLSGFRHKKTKIKEWNNAEVVICEPSTGGWQKWQEALKDNPDNANEQAIAFVVVDCLRDVHGDRIFTYEDVPSLIDVLGPVHGRIYSAAMKLSGFDDEPEHPEDVAEKK